MSDDASPVSRSTGFHEQEPAVAIRRRSFFKLARSAVCRAWTAIRKSIVAAAPVLLVLATAIGGWWVYTGWRTGRIELTTRGAPVGAQVLAESSDTAIGEPFDLVTRAVLALPAGDYRLRVNGKGRLGRTYRFAVNRGETQSHTISIDEGRLLGGEPSAQDLQKTRWDKPINFALVTKAFELTSGKADLIEWSNRSLICRDGASGKVRWDALHPKQPFDLKHNPDPWIPRIDNLFADGSQGSLLELALDLDGDGTRDLLWFLRETPTFLALSGKDGSVLWWNHVAEPAAPGGPRGDDPGPKMRNDPSRAMSNIAGVPAVTDVDRDGTPDLIATMILADATQEQQQGSAETASPGPRSEQPLFRRVVVATSGRSGKRLWSYPVDHGFAVAFGEAWMRLATLVPGKRSESLAFVDATQWFALDPATGRVRAGPIDLGFVPIRPIQHADLDGDGEPEVLALGHGATSAQERLHAFSIKAGCELWAVDVGAALDQPRMFDPPGAKRTWNSSISPDCPLLVDVDDDGRSEIVVPDSGAMPPLEGFRGVRLLDGVTGATRWRSLLRPENEAHDGLAHLVAAPDLDGDGTRDVITVSRYDGRNPSATARAQAQYPHRIFVDALSGKDGRRLWFWHVDLAARTHTRIGAPKWWGRGPDGWPLLALPLGGGEPEQRSKFEWDSSVAAPIVHLLEASTGRERHTVLGLANAKLADLDGDGLADLWGEVDGELRAFRGEAPEAWRALGHFEPAGSFDAKVEIIGSRSVDFDGDGLADLLIADLRAPGVEPFETTGSHTAVARSGRDGHVIWKTEVDPRESSLDPNSADAFELIAFPLPAGDLNGDGTPDVIVKKELLGDGRTAFLPNAKLPVELLSGRTGARLWSTDLLPVGTGLYGLSHFDWVEPRTVEPGGKPDLIVRGSVPFGCRLSRISGRDGRILWDVPFSDQMSSEVFSGKQSHLFDDLDGDGCLDALVVLYSDTAGEPVYTLLAVSLRDGKRLWSQPLRFRFDIDSAGELRIGDVDGDKRPDVVALERFTDTSKNELSVRVFDGRDGKVRWTWKSGFAPQGPGTSGASIALANLDGHGTQNVCVSFIAPRLFHRIVVLDGNGKERACREVSVLGDGDLKAADLNGGGRDELLVLDRDIEFFEGRLCALDRDLKELWSWPARSKLVERPVFDPDEFLSRWTQSKTIDRILPMSPGRESAVIVTPGLAIDAATGRPRWTGQASLVGVTPGLAIDAATGRPRWTGQGSLVDSVHQFTPKLLDPGDSIHLPMLIGNGLGATVCRLAMPTNAQGAIAVSQGNLCVPGARPNDPRWARPLPWLTWLNGFFGPKAFLVAGALGLINVLLPLLVLRFLVGARRVFRMRTLMMVPVIAAVPLMSYLTLAPWLPVGSEPLLASEKGIFLAGTLAGVPIVLYVAAIVASLLRRRPRAVVAMAGLTLVTSLVVAAAWLRFDMRSMARIERYDWQEWYLVALPGAYAAAVLWPFGWGVARAYRLVTRRPRRR